MSTPKPWVKFEEIGENGGQFVFSPLSRGMGTTIGNSLRRVLLSSLSGYAMRSVRIDGVKHEFSTLPFLIEDVFDLISNLKGVVFAGQGDGPFKLSLKSNAKGKVTAKNIDGTGDISIVNKNHFLCELSQKGNLEVEIDVDKGVGYCPSEEHNNEEIPVDAIMVDSSFSPIRKVNHEVENIRVGKELGYDELKIQVWTNGSVTPQDAVREAAQILVDKLSLFNELNKEPEKEVEVVEPSDGDVDKESILSLTVDDLELSARSSNCLKRAGIEKVSELVEKDYSELIKIKNFGKKSADEINEKLKQYGLSLSEA